MGKRGLSPVVATVLILLVTIAAVGIMTPAILKFVRSNLEESSTCFEVLNDLNFAETGYNCNVDDTGGSGNLLTSFSVKRDDAAVSSFKVILQQTGTANTFEVKEGESLADFKMLNPTAPDNFGDPLSMPDVGGARTYIVRGALYEKIEIAPVVGDKTCDIADSINVKVCTDSTVISDIAS